MHTTKWTVPLHPGAPPKGARKRRSEAILFCFFPFRHLREGSKIKNKTILNSSLSSEIPRKMEIKIEKANRRNRSRRSQGFFVFSLLKSVLCSSIKEYKKSCSAQCYV
uniref:Uncharacterized protein n=1 Tax=Xenopus tropicalis TaxID=8364 RepID=A0A1B8XY54_XENTR